MTKEKTEREDYSYFGIYRLTVSNRRTYDKPLKECLAEEVKFKSGMPEDQIIYTNKRAVQNAIYDARDWLKRSRERSRSSYMFTERVVFKACNVYGEIKGVPIDLERNHWRMKVKENHF